MNALFRLKKSFCHKKTFAFVLSFAILFVNTAGAVGMVSMQHGAPGAHSSQEMHAHMVAMADPVNGSTHLHGDAHTTTIKSSASPDGTDESSCASFCAAHCTNTFFYNSTTLSARSLAINAAHLPSQNLHSAMVSGLYKPPRSHH